MLLAFRLLLQVSNLQTWRDFQDVRDVCAAYVACIARRDIMAPGTVLNLASGQACRVGDVLAGLVVLAGIAIEIKVDASQIGDTDICMARGNAARAHELLEWMPVIPWGQTLRDVLDDWRGRVGNEAG